MFRLPVVLITPPPSAPDPLPDVTLAQIKVPLQFFITTSKNR